jgi:hypothetical protein
MPSTSIHPPGHDTSGVNPITKVQPQVAQIELLYPGPLIKRSQVETFADLYDKTIVETVKAQKYYYDQMIVWVKERRSYYYLDNGDGFSAINWKKVNSKVNIEIWSSTEVYLKGEAVFYNSKIFVSKADGNQNHTPLIDYKHDEVDDWWMCIAGETETYRYAFTNTNSFLVFTDIRNPKFEVFTGTPVMNNGNVVIGGDNLPVYSNIEKMEVFSIQRLDLTPEYDISAQNGGLAYELSFYEDSKLSANAYSGYVNVK